MRSPFWCRVLVLSVPLSAAAMAADDLDSEDEGNQQLRAELSVEEVKASLTASQRILDEVANTRDHLAKANDLLGSRKVFKKVRARRQLRKAGEAISRMDADVVRADFGPALVAAIDGLVGARSSLESIVLDDEVTEAQLKEVRETVAQVVDQSEVVLKAARKWRYDLADRAGGGDEEGRGVAGRLVAHSDTWDRYCEGTLRPRQAFDGGSDGKARWTRPFRGSAGTWVVCVDAEGDRVYVGPSTRNEWIHPLPHQRLELVVRSDAGELVEIDRDGSSGIYVAGVQVADALRGDEEATDRGEKSLPDKDPAAVPEVIEHVQIKETYEPGPLTLGVSVDGVDPGSFPDEVEAFADKLDELDKALDDASAALTKAAGEVEVPTVDDNSSDAEKEAAEAKQKEKDDLTAQAKAASEYAGKVSGEAKVLKVLADQLDALPALDRTWLSKQDAAVVSLTTKASSLATTLAATQEDKAETITTSVALLDEDAEGGVAALFISAEALTVALGTPLSPKTDSLSLEVEATYTGAIRPGVSLLFPGVSSTTWEADTHPLGPADEDVVLAKDRGNVNVEFVIGYSQYFHKRPVSKSAPRPALNFGVGVVSLEEGQVSALRSVYLGPEWGWPNLSMAFTGVVRRVPKLQQGVVEGAAVLDPTNLTVDTWTVGFGLIVYPSPELWQTSFGKSGTN